jgi:hypothetical protein
MVIGSLVASEALRKALNRTGLSKATFTLSPANVLDDFDGDGHRVRLRQLLRGGRARAVRMSPCKVI